VIVPNYVARAKPARPPREHGSIHSGIGWRRPVVVPVREDLDRAADVLNSGERVAMLVGAGALHATVEVAETAEILGAGVAKALLGKAVLADDVPYVTGSIGLLGTEASDQLMRDCDTLLMVGSNFPYSQYLPGEGKARGVQIDIDGRTIGLRYPMDMALIGDSRATLRALIPLLERKQDRSWREKIERGVREWWELVESRAATDVIPIDPQRLGWELSRRLPDRCIVSADSGTSAIWLAQELRIRQGMMASVSGSLASMGCAVPYAIGAKFAHPDRVAIALVGDGAMQMNGLAELITIAKYWREWSDPRLVVVVLNNRDLNLVTWEQRMMEGDMLFPASQVFRTFPTPPSPSRSGFPRCASSLLPRSARRGSEPLPAIVRSCSRRSPTLTSLRSRPTSESTRLGRGGARSPGAVPPGGRRRSRRSSGGRRILSDKGRGGIASLDQSAVRRRMGGHQGGGLAGGTGRSLRDVCILRAERV
jgi:pyruvate dehydrogenase (quinone)